MAAVLLLGMSILNVSCNKAKTDDNNLIGTWNHIKTVDMVTGEVLFENSGYIVITDKTITDYFEESEFYGTPVDYTLRGNKIRMFDEDEDTFEITELTNTSLKLKNLFF